MTTGFMVFMYNWYYLYLVSFDRYLNIINPSKYFGFEASAWYWHFVDVVGYFYINSLFWGSGAFSS